MQHNTSETIPGLGREVARLDRDLRLLASRLNALPARFAISGPAGPSGRPVIWARIDSSVAVGAANTWKYAITEVQKTSAGYGSVKWSTKSGGVASSAGYNAFEIFNTASGLLGINLTVEEIEDVNCPYALLPLATGLVLPFTEHVFVEDDAEIIEYWCAHPNSVGPQ